MATIAPVRERPQTSAPTLYPPQARQGVLAAASAGMACLFLAGGVLAMRIPSLVIGLGAMLLFVVAAVLAVAGLLLCFWAASLWTLSYAIDDSVLVIRWGLIRHRVPLSLIEYIVPGEDIVAPLRVRGLNWPGCHIGTALLADVGRVTVFSTHRQPEELVYLIGDGCAYAISPQDGNAFMRAAAEAPAGYEEEVTVTVPSWLGLPLWRDGLWLGVVLAALVVNVAVFGYVAYYYQALLPNISVHLGPLAGVGRIASKRDLFLAPGVGLALLALNVLLAAWAHRSERLASYLVILAGLVIQALLWTAVFRIVAEALAPSL